MKLTGGRTKLHLHLLHLHIPIPPLLSPSLSLQQLVLGAVRKLLSIHDEYYLQTKFQVTKYEEKVDAEIIKVTKIAGIA